jgi:hypothetical protein
VIFEAAQLTDFTVYGVLELQGGLNPRDELPLVDRLGEEIVRPGLNAFDAIVDTIQGGHDDDG